MSSDPMPPRLLHAVTPPLGAYFRVGADHLALQKLVAADRKDFSGIVLDAQDHARHAELRAAAVEAKLEAVLDTKAFELSTPRGAIDHRLIALPWAGDSGQHTPAKLGGDGGRSLVEAIADHVAAGEYTAVLAPSHLATGATAWFALDLALTRQLRPALDQRRLNQVPIYFPLTLSSKLFYDPRAREQVMSRLEREPVDAIWLRIQPFGASTAGPLTLRRYIDAARDLQRLGLPLVGERTGTVGLALMAFGAIGGIESGVTYGERFDVSDMFKPPKPDEKPFRPTPRIYVQQLGTFVSRKQYAELIAKPGMRSALGCRDSECCTRGLSDTTRDPRAHFLHQRLREVNSLSRTPEALRAGIYLEDFLRPATDLALRAAKVTPELDRARGRLEGWRATLGAMQKAGPPPSHAEPPEGKRTHPSLRKSA